MSKHYFEYKGKKCKNITITYGHDIDTPIMLDSLNSFSLLLSEKEENLIKYIILELLTNSIRATNEKSHFNKVYVNLSLEENKLNVKIIDGAGGFDVNILPFDINANIEDLDINSQEFVDYREKFNFQRFGMGLFLAKTWSDAFKIEFIDKEGSVIPYKGAGSTFGTKITIVKDINSILE